MGYETLSLKVKDLAERIDGLVVGDSEIEISAASDVEDAVEGDIVFAEDAKHLKSAVASNASAVIALKDTPPSGKTMILVDKPRLAFAQVLEAFSPALRREPGIHPSAYIGEGSEIGENPSIGYNAYVGQNTRIGDNAFIYPFAYIGDGVVIGDNCVIHPFVSIYHDVILGNNVVIHSGSVIGADGFGYTKVGERHYKIPQIGTLVIGDDVEIGSNTSIDRARTGKTVIGNGTKIDNLVQIGHNVSVGENCIIVSQTGISGSANIGSRVIITGQAGLKDHISIGNDAVLAGRAGVFGDVAPGEFVSGYPARPHLENMKMLAAQRKLPDTMKQVKELEKRIAELEERLK